MIYGQILINSFFLGDIYACVAVGFSLVWGVMNILNILHGTFLMLGGYVTFWLFTLYGIDPFVSMPLAAVLMFCLGYAVQRDLMYPDRSSSTIPTSHGAGTGISACTTGWQHICSAA